MSTADIKENISPIFKEYGIKRAGLFGSFSRGEETSKSDVDILVKVKRGTSLFDMIGYERDLEEIVGCKVDLITYNQIHPLLKKQILNDEVSLV